MRLEGLVARGFRNLAPMEVAVPTEGVALLGANAQGKTNVLEAIYYPVLFRSFRGAADAEVAAFNGPGFRVESTIRHDDKVQAIAAEFRASPLRRKRLEVDGASIERVVDAVGHWLAVAFLPTDVHLASGPAGERRRYLDRLLCLAGRPYLRALTRYRAVLSQRNAALRQGASPVVRAFNAPLAEAGAVLVNTRVRWAEEAKRAFAEEFEALGGTARASLTYRGRAELADPTGWEATLEEVWEADLARRVTTVGPQRDDVLLEIDGRPLRDFGSTGQQRSAAIALKLLEMATLRRAHGFDPALVLDDVFAELDAPRQRALVARLEDTPRSQVFVTAPRKDELPDELVLPVWTVEAGRVTCEAVTT